MGTAMHCLTETVSSDVRDRRGSCRENGHGPRANAGAATAPPEAPMA